MQVNERSQGQIQAQNSFGGLDCWNILVGLPGIDVGIYTAVESSNRSQANGVQVHSCGNLLPHSVVINIFHQLFCLSLTLFFFKILFIYF